MESNDKEKRKRLQVAILLYPGATALDAVGPWEVLSRMPDTEVRFVGKQNGAIMTEGGVLQLSVSHTLADTPSPDVVVVPGGTTTPRQMLDTQTLDWLCKAHTTTIYTASVCTGALILAAAGILKGLPATTHWYKMRALRTMGAKPRPDQRVVQSGKVVTAAGVSAGIDLALWIAGEIAGRERAEAIQLTIEYDPRPPFDAGHMTKASDQTRKLAKKMMDDRMPPDRRSLTLKIAWRRLLDLIRSGK